MCQQDNRGPRVQFQLRNGFIRPIRQDRFAGKTRTGREGVTWVDDGWIVARNPRHRHQSLRNVNRPNDQQPKRRVVHCDKGLAIFFDPRTIQTMI